MSPSVRPSMSQGLPKTCTLTGADLERIHAIEALAYPYPWTLQILRDSLQAPQNQCTGLVSASGYLLGYAFVLTAVGEAQILNITIDPAEQGKGYGRMLLQALIDQARFSSCTQVLLEVRRSNKPARRLYKSFEFITVGVRKGYYPNGSEREDALVMALELL